MMIDLVFWQLVDVVGSKWYCQRYKLLLYVASRADELLFHSLLQANFFIRHPTFAVCDLHCLTQVVNISWSLRIPQLNNNFSEFSPHLELLSHECQASCLFTFTSISCNNLVCKQSSATFLMLL